LIISISLGRDKEDGIKTGFFDEPFKSILPEAWRNQVAFLSILMIF
jgi:hypothetical protein